MKLLLEFVVLSKTCLGLAEGFATMQKQEHRPAPRTARAALARGDLLRKLQPLSDTPGAEVSLSTLNCLKENDEVSFWGVEARLAFRPTSLASLESIGIDATKLGVSSDETFSDLQNSLGYVVLGSSALALASGVTLEGNLGASLTYLFAIFPIIFLGIGSTNPGLIAGGIEALRSVVDPNYTERRLRHEAAHFLMGYLCGIPIASYRTDALSPEVELYDTRTGDDFKTGERTAQTGRRNLSREDVDLISVVALAGAVAECRAFGTARGCQGDLTMLNFLMGKCAQPMGAERQQSQTRWAAAKAHEILGTFQAQHDAVVEAFREKRSVADCIAAIETAAVPNPAT